MAKIKVRIKKDGKTEVEVDGMKGSGCKDLTRSLENALGSVEADKTKGEFYEEHETESENIFQS